MNAARPPSPSAPPPTATASAAPPPDAMSAARGAPTLSAAALAGLRPHVITLQDGRLAAGSASTAQTVREFRTTAADIDEIFSTHLPAFVAAHQPGPVPIALYAHGGLVDKESGFAIAEHQVAWWKENGVYPIHFVWETGLGTSLWDSLRRWASGGRRGWADEAKDGFLEVAARLLGGGGIWNDMKVDAAAASVKGGGAQQFVRALGKWMTEHPGEVEVHAIGHSAGSIFHSHLLPAALEADVPAIASLNLLAPAVRVDTFSKLLMPHARSGKIERVAIFTMDDEAERADTCVQVYNKSLLYLVSASFEPQKATPILGMAKFLLRDVDLAEFFQGPAAKGELVLAPHAVGLRTASTATSHGDFDGDGPTMESVARRIAGVTDVTPFPSGQSRAALPWPDFEDLPPATEGARSASAPGIPAAPGTGARRALCIGVDAYPDEGDRLHGCVADAHAWAEALRGEQFDVTELTDAAATRDEILRSILELVSSAAPGDVLALQYSGHGTFVPDLDGDEDDGDESKDEALCPVDFRAEGRLIIDDDLARIWDVIPEGVSLTAFFDSCHSGSANRAPRVNLTPIGDALPRSVELTREDEAAYRADRGVGTGSTEPDPVRDAAIASVLGSETVTPTAPRNAGVRREVLFSACRATEVAWESNGQGDFTRRALPLLATGAGSVSNRDFVRSVVEEFGQNRRQTPEFHGEEVLGGRLLLGTSSASAVAGDGAGGPPESAQSLQFGGVPQALAPTDGKSPLAALPVASDQRTAAVIAILRATADLLET